PRSTPFGTRRQRQMCIRDSHLPYRLFDFAAYIFYAVAVLLLVAVLMFGATRMGATRWFSFGPINFAPADVAKLALIFALARFFAYSKSPLLSGQRVAVSLGLTVVPMMLILKQPDLGTALTFPVVMYALWFWSGIPPLYLLLIASPLLSLVAASNAISWSIYMAVLLAVLILFKPGRQLIFSVLIVVANLAFGAVMPLVWNRLEEYQQLRIISFVDPSQDPRGAGYQIIQSKIAIGSGGLWGKGFLGGSQTKLDFLPERHTDFIFSVLGEEFGLWGALIVLALFFVFFYRGIRIAARSRSRFLSYVSFGGVAIIFFQFLVNIGMTLGLMPVTGVPLPFLSYGGTSLVLSWVLVAFLLKADYHWQEY
ncbi:MAG: rod shape-determining protein RodA, partial [candidate division Zixibacteria bacterium]|nr:rod shape-determining protein RodA [candidate division Zixibacteria bacterium]